jgi:histidine triad (HIT) family protein
MPSLFTRIINGEIPGRFVWRDDQCVAFLTVAPIRPGHTLVVPREEVDHWIDLRPALAAHLIAASQKIARGVAMAFPCRKMGLMIAGLEVPHVHIHLVPIDEIGDMDFAKQDKDAKSEALDDAAQRIRDALQALGFTEAPR